VAPYQVVMKVPHGIDMTLAAGLRESLTKLFLEEFIFTVILMWEFFVQNSFGNKKTTTV